jgi:hypothetical protein
MSRRSRAEAKLSDQEQKRKLIGIEGQGLYKILIPETGVIICSRNIIFKEGLEHHTPTAKGEFFLSDNNIDVDLPNNPTPAVEDIPPNLEMADLPTKSNMD